MGSIEAFRTWGRQTEVLVAMPAIGRKQWAISEGYIPTNSRPRITIYFSDREPVEAYELAVPARRTPHLRFNELRDPEPIPRGTDFSSLIESNVTIVVQPTRLDSRNGAYAFLSTVAFAAE